MSLLTREAILASEDRPSEIVEVPEWGGSVRVNVMDGPTLALYEEYLDEERAKKDGNLRRARAVIVSLTAIDEHGQRLFTPDDAEALDRKSGHALDRVFAVAIRLNKLRKCDREELEKNSESGRSNDSCSDSPPCNAAPSPSCSGASTPSS